MLQPLLRPLAVAANDRLYGASPVSLPRPPILDLDFVGRPSLQYPGLPPISFTRASVATYRDASGVRRVAAVNEPRFDHDKNGNPLGLLVERSNTNFLLNSLAPATQTTQVLSTGTYTLSVEGSGSASVAGNTATIAGGGTATEGNSITFQITALGSLTVTVTGMLTAFQIENFDEVSSLIVTGGTTATRQLDDVSIPISSFGASLLSGTLLAQVGRLPFKTGAGANVFCALDDGTNSNRVVVFRTSGTVPPYACRAVVTISGSNQFLADSNTAIGPSDGVKIGIAYEAGNTGVGVNGGLLTPTMNNAFTLPLLTTLRLGSQTPSGSASVNGCIRRIQYFPFRVPNSLLQALTAF